jgi:beta-lactamase regulating signal transducer with metallopeptidase domain
MSPDGYLNFAGIFISYFLKVAVAYLLCLLLGRLLSGPRQRFSIWLGFMLGSLAYWVYVVASAFSPTTFSAVAAHAGDSMPGIAHQFLVPIKFQHLAIVLGRILGCAYLLGVLLLVSEGIWKRISLRFCLRQGSTPSSELKHLFDEMCRNFGVRRCELLVLPKVSSPATVYWWRPRVLLPQVCEQLGDSAPMADILCHELSHVARRDYFWSSVNDLICRLLFFHPAVWHARQQMRVHREMACDLAVVAARPEHRADYAHTLTCVARLCLPRKYPVIGIDFAASASLLTHRVHAILNHPEKSSWRKKLSRSVASLALVSAYGFLCSAVSLGIAFAPSHQPLQTAFEIPPAAKAPPHSGPRPRARKDSVSHPEESLITESPAYRLGSSPGSASHESQFPANSGENLGDESTGSSGTVWARPAPGSKPVGATVESIIVATVGTVIGIDRDDRSKRHDSSHFQSSTTVPTLY